MTRKLLTLMFAIAVSLSAMAQFEKAPAFPGAEGHGRFVTGGRGGKIVHVTNLNDSGTGSLRAAVSGTAKKIVVFDVAGVIALRSNLNIGDNTTIMGQTAPSPGITVRYYTVQPGNNNIIRFMRFRRGQEKDVDDGGDAMWQRNKSNIILDHCSFSWSIDEVASFYDNNCFTMQWCTIAESLLKVGHSKGEHGYGGIWGGKLASFHHNMIAHVANRGPRFNGARYNWTGYKTNAEYSKYNWANAVEAENVDFRNCLMYNAEGTCYGGPGGGQINMVNNYFQAGPSGRGSADRITTVSVATSGNSENTPFVDMTSRYYISGNTVKTSKGTTANRDWAGVKYDSGVTTIDGEYYCKDNNNYYTKVEHKTSGSNKYVRIKMDAPCPTGYVTTHNAEMARYYVLQYVGSSLYRDEVDQRYVNEATNGTLTYTGSVSRKQGLIDLVSDCKGYTEANFPTGAHPSGFDTDNDGMPDAWETKNGLNPNDASDATRYNLDSKRYYTNIEVYCHSLVEDIIVKQNKGAETKVEEYFPDMQNGETGEPGDGGDSGSGDGGDGGNDDGGADEPTVTIDEEVFYYWEDGMESANSVTFTDGATATITGNSSKSISNGRDITIDGKAYTSLKVSNGAENTFVAPAGKTPVQVTFYSYVNKAEEEASATNIWAAVGGTTYTAETTTVLKSFLDGANPDVVTFPLAGNSSTFTYKNSGTQLCYVMKVAYGSVTGGSTGIANITVAAPQTTATYNLQGQRVPDNYRGIVIRNGKKFFNR